jgi:hypothetical protein
MKTEWRGRGTPSSAREGRWWTFARWAALDVSLLMSPILAGVVFRDGGVAMFVAVVATLVWIAIMIVSFLERAPVVAKLFLILSCPLVPITALVLTAFYCWGHGCRGWPTDP